MDNKVSCVALLDTKDLIIDLSRLYHQQLGDIGDCSVGIIDKVNLLGLVSCRCKDGDK